MARLAEKEEMGMNDSPSFKKRCKRFIETILQEGLSPGRASAAVFVGVFIGVVPIYGLQSIVAIGLAILFRLNKAITFAATFVNNPLFQPFLVLFSLETGHFLLEGDLIPIALGKIAALNLLDWLIYWLVGSLVFGGILAGLVALLTYTLLIRRARKRSPSRGRYLKTKCFIGMLFKTAPRFDRNFVRLKIRFDRMFAKLADIDLGSGPVFDLGCGYGLGLAVAASQDTSRKLIGCDLDAHRIAVAKTAFSDLQAELSVADIKEFELGSAGLILILDVLQYLEPDDQLCLLERCCDSLIPGGKLIFRVHDKKRGLFSWLALALDKLIFLLSRCEGKPKNLLPSEYRAILERKSLAIRELSFINKLPLAHILFIAEKPDR